MLCKPPELIFRSRIYGAERQVPNFDCGMGLNCGAEALDDVISIRIGDFHSCDIEYSSASIGQANIVTV
ncbi:hypothetical protein WI70_21220 [Burkholderia cepacia]|nr:hypothetical protein WI47_32860 [Burkholderia cepacia]KVC17001.1 hypothetical protein WI70_21220 [Burkholderia cepacia]